MAIAGPWGVVGRELAESRVDVRQASPHCPGLVSSEGVSGYLSPLGVGSEREPSALMLHDACTCRGGQGVGHGHPMGAGPVHHLVLELDPVEFPATVAT